MGDARVCQVEPGDLRAGRLRRLPRRRARPRTGRQVGRRDRCLCQVSFPIPLIPIGLSIYITVYISECVQGDQVLGNIYLRTIKIG